MVSGIQTVSANFIFHFVLLGLVVRFLFFHDMGNESWIILIAMFLIMNPVIAYFCGRDMNAGAACVPAGAPFYKRTLVFVVSGSAYLYMLLTWFGIIEIGGGAK